MMKRTHSFTMIEIVLALGVITIGVIAVLGLFPVGLNAGRDAVAESHACEAADQFLHYVEFCIRNDLDEDGNAVADGWEYWIWDGNTTQEIPGTAAAPNDQTLSLPAWGLWQNGTMHDIGTAGDGIYKIVTFVDSPPSTPPTPPLSAGDIRDFQGILAIWQEDIALLDDDANLQTPSNRDIGVALKLEISWPAQADYADRQKSVYHYELFNR